MVSHKHSLSAGFTSCACGIPSQTWTPGLSAPGQLPTLTAGRQSWSPQRRH